MRGFRHGEYLTKHEKLLMPTCSVTYIDKKRGIVLTIDERRGL
jgi:hypothetical protein